MLAIFEKFEVHQIKMFMSVSLSAVHVCVLSKYNRLEISKDLRLCDLICLWSTLTYRLLKKIEPSL